MSAEESSFLSYLVLSREEVSDGVLASLLENRAVTLLNTLGELIFSLLSQEEPESSLEQFLRKEGICGREEDLDWLKKSFLELKRNLSEPASLREGILRFLCEDSSFFRLWIKRTKGSDAYTLLLSSFSIIPYFPEGRSSAQVRELLKELDPRFPFPFQGIMVLEGETLYTVKPEIVRTWEPVISFLQEREDFRVSIVTWRRI